MTNGQRTILQSAAVLGVGFAIAAGVEAGISVYNESVRPYDFHKQNDGMIACSRQLGETAVLSSVVPADCDNFKTHFVTVKEVEFNPTSGLDKTLNTRYRLPSSTSFYKAELITKSDYEGEDRAVNIFGGIMLGFVTATGTALAFNQYNRNRRNVTPPTVPSSAIVL